MSRNEHAAPPTAQSMVEEFHRLFSIVVHQTLNLDGLELIPITNKSITEFYPRADIPANVYEWQRTAVNSVAVKAVLVSFDFRRKDCDNVGRFAQTMSKQMSWLLQNGRSV